MCFSLIHFSLSWMLQCYYYILIYFLVFKCIRENRFPRSFALSQELLGCGCFCSGLDRVFHYYPHTGLLYSHFTLCAYVLFYKLCTDLRTVAALLVCVLSFLGSLLLVMLIPTYLKFIPFFKLRLFAASLDLLASLNVYDFLKSL